MSVLLAHPTGNNFVREAAVALHHAGILGELHLSIASCGSNFFAFAGRLPGGGAFARREYPLELSPLMRLHPWRECIRLLGDKFGWNRLLRHEYGWASIDACYQSFDRQIAQRLANPSTFDRVYGYEDGSLETFRTAKNLGLNRIYDLPIAYWKVSRQIMEEESERMPDWRPTLTAVLDSKEKCRRKDEEMELANCIICPSNFVAASIPPEIRANKPVYVIPFGSPVGIKPAATKSRSGKKLRILFAGSMSQRKGLGDLFAAMKLLNPELFELHIMGALIAPMPFYRKEFTNFIHHRTRPNHEVLELMRQCDVLVLPSLVEGRALVQQEALACGLPIIVTANAGAQDLVDDGKAGFLVPIRSPESIADKLVLLQKNTDLLNNMRDAAPRKAAEVSWEAYRQGITDAVLST